MPGKGKKLGPILLTIAIVLSICLGIAAYFFMGLTWVYSLIIGVSGIVLSILIFLLLRVLNDSTKDADGWSDPVINEKKARKIIHGPNYNEDEVDFSTDTGKVNEEELAGEFVQMGRLLIKSERYAEAKDAFLKAAEKDPGNSKVYNYLGIACGRLNEFEQAIDAYSKAVALDYDYASAHFNLAIMYEQTGDTANAIKQWERYLEIGKVVGEREDMLERAEDRMRCLSEGKDKVRPKQSSPPDEF